MLSIASKLEPNWYPVIKIGAKLPKTRQQIIGKVAILSFLVSLAVYLQILCKLTCDHPKEVPANLLFIRFTSKVFKTHFLGFEENHLTTLVDSVLILFAGWENQISQTLDRISWFPSLALNKHSLLSPHPPPSPTAKMFKGSKPEPRYQGTSSRQAWGQKIWPQSVWGSSR